MTVVVLAVDDEALNNELVERVFRGRKDIKLLTSDSGEAAIELLTHNRVDLMLR